MIIKYTPQVKIENISSLPSGLKCNFLWCITGLNGEIIAKQWKRKPIKINGDDILVTFTKTAHKQALQINKA